MVALVQQLHNATNSIIPGTHLRYTCLLVCLWSCGSCNSVSVVVLTDGL